MDLALESIEASILPSTVMLLDGLLDSSVLARPGVDAAAHASELRGLARQVGILAAGLAGLVPAQAPARLRMSA